jgi:PE-PGRS family protein with aspartyl peptidase-like domain
MAGRDSADGNMHSRNAKVRHRRVVIMGGAVGAFLAAAAMATGSAVTAAPAKADFEDLLDPVIQPLLTSLTDAISGFDPAATTDLTSWTDSLLSSLNSIDLALPSAAEPASSLTSSAADVTTPTNVDIPLTVSEDTEPVVNVSVNGGSEVPVLVDTGSSGLVLPLQDIGLSDLETLGLPTGLGFSGYSGGVDYIYLTFDTTVNFDGIQSTSPTDVYVPIISFPTTLDSPSSFEAFAQDDDVDGILGIGPTGAGPGIDPISTSDLPGDLGDGVTVDIPAKELILGPNPFTTDDVTTSGAPIPTLYEQIGNGTPVQVSDDIDSGGVYGTIPSSLESGGSVPPDTTITVYNSPGGTELYSYTTGTDSLGDSTSPTVVSGTSIDSGVEPFLNEPIFIDYLNNTTTFDQP